MFIRIAAKDLKAGHLVRGERGDRSYLVLSVTQYPGTTLPIEVKVQGKGTWHFKPTDRVEVKAQ